MLEETGGVLDLPRGARRSYSVILTWSRVGAPVAWVKERGAEVVAWRRRQLIAAGAVEVDGETETRRGRQLHGGEEVRVTTDAAERRVEVGPNLAPQD